MRHFIYVEYNSRRGSEITAPVGVKREKPWPEIVLKHITATKRAGKIFYHKTTARSLHILDDYHFMA